MNKYLILPMIIFALIFTNCKKEDDSEVSTDSTYLKMKIDNENEQNFDASVTVLLGYLNIVGTNSSKTLTIQFSSDESGDVDEMNYAITYSEGDDVIFDSETAYDSELEITKNDSSGKIVAGEFTVEYYDDAQNLHTATGSFNLEY